MLKRSAAVVSAAVMLTTVLAAPAQADDRLPLPLLPHVPFYPTVTVKAAAKPVKLTSKRRKFNPTYRYKGKTRTLSGFLNRSSTTGYLVLHGTTIADERYFSGYSATSRFNSWSVGKSLTSTAVGAAIADGDIRSVRDKIVTYVPELRGTGYDGATIRDVLQMSSGHDYDETDYFDITQGATATTIRTVLGTSLTDQAIEAERAFTPGTRFNYDSMNTFVLGWLVSKATGKSLATYLRDRIWRPAGMKTPMLMGHDRQGNAMAYCCYHVTVRDFARFGLLFLNRGRAGNRQVIPSHWVKEATTPSKPFLRPGRLYPGNPYGYGYQWWTADQGDYTAIGVLGQFVYVSPRHRVIIVKTSEDLNAELHEGETLTAFRAVATAVDKKF